MYLSVWPIRISDEDLKKINKSGRPSNVKYREIDGGGNMGTIEVFHQLHCLVRKNLRWMKIKHLICNQCTEHAPKIHLPKWISRNSENLDNTTQIHAQSLRYGLKLCQCSILVNSYPLADHCIEMIRQNLMCIADVGVISWVLPIA